MDEHIGSYWVTMTVTLPVLATSENKAEEAARKYIRDSTECHIDEIHCASYHGPAKTPDKS